MEAFSGVQTHHTNQRSGSNDSNVFKGSEELKKSSHPNISAQRLVNWSLDCEVTHLHCQKVAVKKTTNKDPC